MDENIDGSVVSEENGGIVGVYDLDTLTKTRAILGKHTLLYVVTKATPPATQDDYKLIGEVISYSDLIAFAEEIERVDVTPFSNSLIDEEPLRRKYIDGLIDETGADNHWDIVLNYPDAQLMKEAGVSAYFSFKELWEKRKLKTGKEGILDLYLELPDKSAFIFTAKVWELTPSLPLDSQVTFTLRWKITSAIEYNDGSTPTPTP